MDNNNRVELKMSNEDIARFREKAVNDHIAQLKEYAGLDVGKVSDGFHTFEELYEHRIVLFMALCKQMAGRYIDSYPNPYRDIDFTYPVWRSKVQSDGTSDKEWFLLGMYYGPGQQITYHIPISKWDECTFAETLDAAPPFDGHTSEDVLQRLKSL